MITFHEIKGMMQKMAILSVHITRLNELLPQVVLLSESIDSLNEDITLQRDRMTAEIRSVEILGEVLKTHVYQNQAIAGPNLISGELDKTKRKSVTDESRAPMTDAGDLSATTQKNARPGRNPRRDESSRTL